MSDPDSGMPLSGALLLCVVTPRQPTGYGQGTPHLQVGCHAVTQGAQLRLSHDCSNGRLRPTCDPVSSCRVVPWSAARCRTAALGAISLGKCGQCAYACLTKSFRERVLTTASSSSAE